MTLKTVIFQHLTLLVLTSVFALVSTASPSDPENSENSSPYWTSAHVKTFEGETYHIVYAPKLTWAEAVTSCANAGLVLTSIETKEQLDFLISVANLTGAANPWIGASRPLSGGNFTWVANGQVVPSFIWSPREPNNLNGTEYYGHITVHGANDMRQYALAYICTTKTGRLPTTPQPEETTTEEPAEPTTEQETTSGTTTTRRPIPGICTEPGIIPDPFDCTKYHVCEYNEAGDIWDSVFQCPATTVWCQGSLNCESPDFCPCKL